MYGPQMKEACPMCTSYLDGMNGNAQHIRRRASFAVCAKSPIARIREFARGRGWNGLRLISSANNDYNRDFHGESPEGGQVPMMNVFEAGGRHPPLLRQRGGFRAGGRP
jgi:predicted dithiol-disulfide oxidoreductase (DUF899 family)